MKQELPNLVDERRFRRREPEQVERDEFGRVSITDFDDETIADMHIAQMARGEDSDQL